MGVVEGRREGRNFRSQLFLRKISCNETAPLIWTMKQDEVQRETFPSSQCYPLVCFCGIYSEVIRGDNLAITLIAM